MQRSYLIQRLRKPRHFEGKFAGLENAFSFGGGLKNGGLNDEAMRLIKDIFTFDYMGSAEFEFGAVPKTLEKIVKNIKDYIAFDLIVKYKWKSWRTKEVSVGEKDIYVICNKHESGEVIKRIKKFAKSILNDTKEMISLDETLAGSDSTKNLAGWLELDNGYMFFSDKEMFEKTIKLFGIFQSKT